MEQQSATTNGVKLLGEYLLPGASLMMEGKIGHGAAHTVGSLVARMLLGPAGVALVAANSFANSTTGQGLLKNIRGSYSGKTEAAPAEAEQPEAT